MENGMIEEKLVGTQAKQLIVDLYRCQNPYIDNEDYIRDIIHKVCENIRAGIVQECYHKFMPIGISAVAIITTSHISIHTWPEYGYVAVDIFSCQEEIPEKIYHFLAELLEAEEVETRIIKRAFLKEKGDIYGKNAATP